MAMTPVVMMVVMVAEAQSDEGKPDPTIHIRPVIIVVAIVARTVVSRRIVHVRIVMIVPLTVVAAMVVAPPANLHCLVGCFRWR